MPRESMQLGETRAIRARVRLTQKVLGDYEIEHATRHENAIKAGHFGIGVSAPRKAQREKVRKILKAHRGHFINFYGRRAMELLNHERLDRLNAALQTMGLVSAEGIEPSTY